MYSAGREWWREEERAEKDGRKQKCGEKRRIRAIDVKALMFSPMLSH